MDYIACGETISKAVIVKLMVYNINGVRDGGGTELYPLETVVRTPPTVQARVRQGNGSGGGAEHHPGPHQGVILPPPVIPDDAFPAW